MGEEEEAGGEGADIAPAGREEEEVVGEEEEEAGGEGADTAPAGREEEEEEEEEEAGCEGIGVNGRGKGDSLDPVFFFEGQPEAR